MTLEIKAENFDILEDALREMGYTPQRVGESVRFYGTYGPVVIQNGKVGLDRRDEQLINKINQGYSRQVIYKVAKKKGLKIRETSRNNFVVVRR